jgi:hypothetical protein
MRCLFGSMFTRRGAVLSAVIIFAALLPGWRARVSYEPSAHLRGARNLGHALAAMRPDDYIADVLTARVQIHRHRNGCSRHLHLTAALAGYGSVVALLALDEDSSAGCSGAACTAA